MTDRSETSKDRVTQGENAPRSLNILEPGATQQDPQQLSGLLSEMQALFAIMPSVGQLANAKMATEEEIEAQFDNMPI